MKGEEGKEIRWFGTKKIAKSKENRAEGLIQPVINALAVRKKSNWVS